MIRALLVLFIVVSGAGASTVAVSPQTVTMSLKLTHVGVERLFSEIEKNSEYVFLYKKNVVQNKIVSVESQEETLSEILDRALPAVGLSYHINGNQIVVVEKPQGTEHTSVTATPQQALVRVKGLVYDELNEPMIGVSIVEKGNHTNGTVTDMDGNFTLSVSPGAVLVCTYMGYVRQEVKVPADGNIGKILMQEDMQTLGDVVVVGYGMQKKVNLTGSLTTISSKDLEGRTNTNLLQSLQGAAPVVTVISRPG